jgi:hypothetical protein
MFAIVSYLYLLPRYTYRPYMFAELPRKDPVKSSPQI